MEIANSSFEKSFEGRVTSIQLSDVGSAVKVIYGVERNDVAVRVESDTPHADVLFVTLLPSGTLSIGVNVGTMVEKGLVNDPLMPDNSNVRVEVPKKLGRIPIKQVGHVASLKTATRNYK